MTVGSPLCDKACCTECSCLVFKMQTSSFFRIGNFTSLRFAEERYNRTTNELTVQNIHPPAKRKHTRYGTGKITGIEKCQSEYC